MPFCTSYVRSVEMTTQKLTATQMTAGWRRRNPDAARAYSAVRYAVRVGKLVPGPCAVCGSTESQAHHANGYTDGHALDVAWLCRPHHRAAHERPITHGERSGYLRGCRCDPCREANTVYCRGYWDATRERRNDYQNGYRRQRREVAA